MSQTTLPPRPYLPLPYFFLLLCLFTAACQQTPKERSLEVELERVVEPKRETASQINARGKTLYKEMRYRDAKKEFEEALSVDPENKVGQFHLQMIDCFTCSYPMGSALTIDRGVRVRQERIELMRLFDSGRARLNAGEFEQAKADLERVRERIEWSPYQICSEQFSEHLGDLIEAAGRGNEFLRLRGLRDELKRRKIPLALENTSLRDAVAAIQGATWIRIHESASVRQGAKRMTIERASLSIWDALLLILRQTDLGLRPNKDGFKIVEKEATGAFVVRQYKIADLQKPKELSAQSPNLVRSGGKLAVSKASKKTVENSANLESIVEAVKSDAIHGNWSGLATIEIKDGQLIVFQTLPVHRQIASFMGRSSRDAEVRVRLEFTQVSIVKSLLKKIGIDFEELTTSANPILGSPVEFDPNPENFSRCGSSIMLPTRGPSGRDEGSSDRLDNIIDGSQGTFLSGRRLNGSSVWSRNDESATQQACFVDPIQINALVKLGRKEGKARRRTVLPLALFNRESFSISSKTPGAYISDYELSSAGFMHEIADPMINSFPNRLEWSLCPVVSKDRRSITFKLKRFYSPKLSSNCSVSLPVGGILVLALPSLQEECDKGQRVVSILLIKLTGVERN